MNKQEAIKEIEKLEKLTILDETIGFDIEMIPKNKTLNIIRQLNEPEKPVVPQFWRILSRNTKTKTPL